MKHWILTTLLLMSITQITSAGEPPELQYRGFRPWEIKELKKLPKVDKIVVYKKYSVPGTTAEVKLGLYIFNPKNHKPGDKTPAILFFSGGGGLNGWGHLAQFYLHCNYLASRGMVAMCVDRRNGRRPGLSPEDEKKYRAVYSENMMIADAKSAFRYVRSHAQELGIDPDKIAGGCSSYGGFTISNTCIHNGINEKGEDTSVSCRPMALVMFCPVLDRRPSIGYHPLKNWRKVSPLQCVNMDFPPTLIMVGDRDTVLPASTATLFQQTLKAMGIRCDLHIYPQTYHGLNKPRYYETMHEVDKFLVSLGLLSGKATLTKEKGEAVYSNAPDAGK